MSVYYNFVPFDNPSPPFAYWDDGFTRQELDVLQNLAINSTTEARIGGVSGGNTVDYNTRRSKVTWLSLDEKKELEWVFGKLSFLITKLNSQFYRYELKGFGEHLQLTNYDSEYLGTYDWHIDRGNETGKVRKMSAVLQLTEPGEYEGGNLQLLYTNPDPITVEKKRGKLVIFPSHTIHRVSPVTQGSRQSLVAWICGEPLR